MFQLIYLPTFAYNYISFTLARMKKNLKVAFQYFHSRHVLMHFLCAALCFFRLLQLFTGRHLISCCYNTKERLLPVQVFIGRCSPSLLISEVCRALSEQFWPPIGSI